MVTNDDDKGAFFSNHFEWGFMWVNEFESEWRSEAVRTLVPEVSVVVKWSTSRVERTKGSFWRSIVSREQRLLADVHPWWSKQAMMGPDSKFTWCQLMFDSLAEKLSPTRALHHLLKVHQFQVGTSAGWKTSQVCDMRSNPLLLGTAEKIKQEEWRLLICLPCFRN